jgi:hypothetical protein
METDDLPELLSRLPKNEFIEIRVEEDDDGKPSLGACHFVEPPDGGWETRSDYFGHSPDSPTNDEPCPPQWKFEPRVIYGISVDIQDRGEFLTLLAEAIERRLSVHQ